MAGAKMENRVCSRAWMLLWLWQNGWMIPTGVLGITCFRNGTIFLEVMLMNVK